MKKKIVAVLLIALMSCESGIAYAAEQQVLLEEAEIAEVSEEVTDDGSKEEITNEAEKELEIVEESPTVVPEVTESVEQENQTDITEIEDVMYEEDVNSNVIEGTSISWTVENNVLTISTSAENSIIPDYSLNKAPEWNIYRDIRQVVIQSGIKEIGEYAFYGMKNLEKVTINSDTLESIGNHAFDDCENLEEINLPDSLSAMGIYAFARCTKLNKISSQGFVTPASLKEIPEYAFAKCGNIEEVVFSENTQKISSSAFYRCGGIKSVSFRGMNLQEISDWAFGNSGLESIVIPEGIKVIGEKAFANCNSMKHVGIKATNEILIANSAFDGSANIDKFYVMENCAAYDYADVNFHNECTTYRYMANERKDTYYRVEISGDTTYSGKEIRPKVKVIYLGINGNSILQEGIDYKLLYSNNVQIGDSAKVTITGINGYYGNMDVNFSIYAKDISKNGRIGDIQSQSYTGKEVEPEVTVTFNDTMLKKDRDYIVSYENNVNVGSHAKVVVTGTGAYTGIIEKEFSIVTNIANTGNNSAEKAKVNKAKITVKKQTYTGKNLKPSVVVILNGKKLTLGKDYTVIYKNNKKIGKDAKVIVTGIGNYCGSITKKFTIAPPKPKVKISGKKLKITNYQSGADVYLSYTVKGGKQKGKLLWQAKKYKSKKSVDLTQLIQKYKNKKITITVTMKVNDVESAASKKVTVK